MRITWSPQCPVIKVNAHKTREPPELGVNAGFIYSGLFFTFSIGTESDYLPIQRTTAGERNP